MEPEQNDPPRKTNQLEVLDYLPRMRSYNCVDSLASRSRRRAAAIMSGELSMPTTCAPRRNQFFRQYAVAATQIEDALAGLGVEQVQHGLTERRNEMSIIGIGGRTPLLGWD
jgi:hypothetical protein